MKIGRVGAKLFHWDAFRNFANAPKMETDSRVSVTSFRRLNHLSDFSRIPFRRSLQKVVIQG